MNANVSIALIASLWSVLPGVVNAGSPLQQDRSRALVQISRDDLSLPAGNISVSLLERGGRRVGFRIETETDHSAEAIEVDSMKHEIRGFGLVFGIENDNTGAPTLIRVANGVDSVEVKSVADEAETAQERLAARRLTKYFNDSNGPQRVLEFKALLQAYANRHAQSGRVATNDVFGCIMDIVGIALDWVGVVGACGAPVVDLFVCIPSILWATADTVRTAEAIGNDCG